MEFKCPGREGNNQILHFEKSKATGVLITSKLTKEKKKHPKKDKKGEKEAQRTSIIKRKYLLR